MKKTFKGTKGNWTTYSSSITNNDEKITHSVYVGTSRIALCYNLFEFDKSKNVSPEEAEENAKLIAAAPELLEALQSMVYLFDRGLPHPSIGRDCCDKAINVINKCTS